MLWKAIVKQPTVFFGTSNKYMHNFFLILLLWLFFFFFDCLLCTISTWYHQWVHRIFRCSDAKLEMEYAVQFLERMSRAASHNGTKCYKTFSMFFILSRQRLTLEPLCDIDELWLLWDQCLMINLGVLTNGKHIVDAVLAHDDSTSFMSSFLLNDGLRLLTLTFDNINISFLLHLLYCCCLLRACVLVHGFEWNGFESVRKVLRRSTYSHDYYSKSFEIKKRENPI